MAGKVCMITGSNSGIGKATAVKLAKIGATVVMVCRDKKKGESTLTEIEARTGNEAVTLMLTDLSSQESIHQLAKDFKKQYGKLHVLINNAGVFLARRSVTVDGIETTFAVNHLAYFLLTNLLIDTLKASTPARIINVSSRAHHTGTIDFDNLQGEKHYNGYRAYSQSKLANVLFTYELAKRLEGTGVTTNCLHPGFVKTGLLRGKNAGWYFPIITTLLRPFMLSSEKGSETCVYLAASPEVEGVSSKYFVKKAEVTSSTQSYNGAVARRLWEVSAALTKLSA